LPWKLIDGGESIPKRERQIGTDRDVTTPSDAAAARGLLHRTVAPRGVEMSYYSISVDRDCIAFCSSVASLKPVLTMQSTAVVLDGVGGRGAVVTSLIGLNVMASSAFDVHFSVFPNTTWLKLTARR